MRVKSESEVVQSTAAYQAPPSEGGIHALLPIKQITNENLLSSTGNSTQCSVMTSMGRKFKNRGDICIPIFLHGAVVKNAPTNCISLAGDARDVGSIPRTGDPLGEEIHTADSVC